MTTTVSGFAASPGSVEGVARVVTDVADVGLLAEGEILVAPMTEPRWMPAFARCAAVVTDVGGIMSHAAIICREYGLPAVTGTGDGTSLIRSGQRVRVDGTAGVVTVLPLIDAEQFERRGYVVAENLLSPADLQPVRDEYERLLDDLAQQWWSDGLVPDRHEGVAFESRLARLVQDGDVPYYKPFDISLRFGRVTAEDPIHLGAAVFGLLTHRSILGAVERLIGPEIYCSPIQHARIKVPERLLADKHRTSLSARAAWHQDQAAALPEADDTDVVTAWVAVTDATVANGCLRVVPGSHRELLAHCSKGKAGRNLSIPDDRLPGAPVSLEVGAGSVIFMHRRLIHGSHVNTSDRIRWSFDLRYQPTGQPTGRPQFPGFVAHSLRAPEQVITDWRQWAKLWLDTRTRLAEVGREKGEFRRWTGEEAAC